MKYMFCLVMFCFWQPVWVAGQNQQLTLNECIAYAKSNHFTFKIQALKNKQAEINTTKSLSRFLPQISANFNHQYDFGSAIDPNTNSRASANFQFDNLNLNAQINLFNFSELWESELQQKNVNIEQANSKVIEQEYLLTLIEKFYSSLATQEWITVLKEQTKNTELQVDRITKEVQEGLKPESDVYDIQGINTQEKKQLKVLEQQQINKITELLQWINKPFSNSETFTLIKNTNHHLLSTDIKIENNVLLKLEKEKYDKLEIEHKQLTHNFLPRIGLGYSFGSFYSKQIDNIGSTSFDFGNQLRNNKSQYLGLGIQIPIFSRGDNWRLMQTKKIQLSEQNLLIEKVKVEQTNRLDNYYRTLSQYQEMSPILKEASKYAIQSLETTQTKYEYGKVDIASYKAAKNQVLLSAYDIVNNELSIGLTQEILNLLNN